MKTDGLFTIHQVEIKTPYNTTWRLVPFGDVHHDSPNFSRDKWDQFREWGARQTNCLFLGMGDYTDSYSTSERMLVYADGIHESTRKRDENLGRQRVRDIAKELDFMRGKCVGLLGGNHYQFYCDGTTGDQYLAQLLGTRYLGVCSAIRLSFIRKGSHTTSTVDIFCHHGRGAGQTAGGKMNSVEKLAGMADADIYLMGDNHARGVLPLGNKLRIESDAQHGLRLRHRESWIGRTGSFLRGYVPGESNYVTDAALPPANLGWISFLLTPRRNRDDGSDTVTVEIHAEQ